MKRKYKINKNIEPTRIRNIVEQISALFHKAYFYFSPPQKRLSIESEYRKKIFERIINEKRWGETNISGGGSTVEYTKSAREIIHHVIKDFNIKSLLDAACGDFVWMPIVLKALPNDFTYIGCDIVPGLIKQHKNSYPQYEFKNIDFVNDNLPSCDLILCRDALQHLSIIEIKKALHNFSNCGAKYLLATTHILYPQWKNKRDIRSGQCRDRNLLLKPFSLGDPIVIYHEENIGHKYLGLWKLPVNYEYIN